MHREASPDENLSHHHPEFLRRQGYDAVSVTESGLTGESDARVREFAIDSGRILITLDADFANMLRLPPTGTPGVIRLKIHPPLKAAIRDQILRAVQALKDVPMSNRLAVVHRNTIRIRS